MKHTKEPWLTFNALRLSIDACKHDDLKAVATSTFGTRSCEDSNWKTGKSFSHPVRRQPSCQRVLVTISSLLDRCTKDGCFQLAESSAGSCMESRQMTDTKSITLTESGMTIDQRICVGSQRPKMLQTSRKNLKKGFVMHSDADIVASITSNTSSPNRKFVALGKAQNRTPESQLDLVLENRRCIELRRGLHGVTCVDVISSLIASLNQTEKEI